MVVAVVAVKVVPLPWTVRVVLGAKVSAPLTCEAPAVTVSEPPLKLRPAVLLMLRMVVAPLLCVIVTPVTLMFTSSPVVGTLLVDQLPLVFQLRSPAPPVQSRAG